MPLPKSKPKSWLESLGLSFSRISPSRSIFTCSLVWNSVLAHQMILNPFGSVRLLSHIRPVTFLTGEIVQWMGGLRLGYAALALQALVSGSASQSSFAFAFLGITQFLIGLSSWHKGRWYSSRLLIFLLAETTLAAGHLLHYLEGPKKEKEEM